MERNLLLGSLALALMGWLAGFLLSRTGPPGAARASRRGLAIGVIVIIVIGVKVAAARAMWPPAYPWAIGMGLGGLAAWLGAWTLDRLEGLEAALARAAAAAAPMFLTVAVSAAAATWLRPALVETLLGIGFGWLLVTIAAYADAFGQTAADGTGRLAALVPNLGFALTLPAAVALGTFRDAALQTTAWSTALIVLAVGVPLALILVGAVGGRSGQDPDKAGSGIIAAFVASIVFGALAILIGFKLLAQPRFPMAAGVGLVTSLIVWWLCVETAGESSRDTATGLPTGPHALAVLAALGGVVAGFYLLVGFGVGLAMLAAWLPVTVALVKAHSTPQRHHAVLRTSLLLMLGFIVLLYRVFVQRFDADLAGTSLTDHFAIFTFLAGLIIPGLLARVLTQPVAGTGRLLIRLVAVYALMALVPAMALALWGARAAIGMLAGFAAAAIVYVEAPAAAAVAAGIALLLAQWGHHAVSISTLTRDDRVKIVVGLAVVTVIALVIGDVWARSINRAQLPNGSGRSTKGALS